MNRAERRRLKHKVPQALTLIGGPMDSYVVKPNAPALHPDWITGLQEAKAAGLYNEATSPTGETFQPAKGVTPWAELDDATRRPFREQARAIFPDGRYVPDGPMRAKWVEHSDGNLTTN